MIIWKEIHKWLVYSGKQGGVYCKYCAFFSKKEVGHTSSQQVGALCSEPYRSWKKALEKFALHEKAEYHQKSVLDFIQLKNIVVVKFNKHVFYNEQIICSTT